MFLQCLLLSFFLEVVQENNNNTVIFCYMLGRESFPNHICGYLTLKALKSLV